MEGALKKGYSMSAQQEKMDDKLKRFNKQSTAIKSLINANSFSQNSSYLKSLITDIFYFGSDAHLIAKVGYPLTFWGMGFLDSKPCTWLEKKLHFKVEWLWGPLLDTVIFLVECIGTARMYYWIRWLQHYIKEDTNFNETMIKMARNPLVPYDMTEFYRILIYGNDPRFEFVKENSFCIHIEDMYRKRQIRNGLVPQF